MKFLQKVSSKEEATQKDYDVIYATSTEIIIKKSTPTINFTFGSVDSHNKAKANAVVGDICYVGNTPIGVVVIKNEDKVKIMSLFNLNEDGSNSSTYTGLPWGVMGVTTKISDINDGKANTSKLVALGSDYKAAIACSLYSTEGTSKGDWYLPASQEFENMQWKTNKTDIQSSLNSLGTLALSLYEESIYWSSTESSGPYKSSLACGLHTFTKSITEDMKSNSFNIRAFCEV